MKKQYHAPELEYVSFLTQEDVTRGNDTCLDVASNPFFKTALED